MKIVSKFSQNFYHLQQKTAQITLKLFNLIKHVQSINKQPQMQKIECKTKIIN